MMMLDWIQLIKHYLTRKSRVASSCQLTIMFCDLVGSTTLSEQLSPCDYLRVLQLYQKACASVIATWNGYLAQLLGDGLLIYFGYPQACHDHAYQAVQASHEMIAAVEKLNVNLLQEIGIELAIRIGICCGEAVIADLGTKGEKLAVGVVPNIAARLQHLAAPNSVVLCSATYQQYLQYLNFEYLGYQKLRGITEPIEVYQIFPRKLF